MLVNSVSNACLFSQDLGFFQQNFQSAFYISQNKICQGFSNIHGFESNNLYSKYYIQYTLVSTNTRGPSEFVRLIRNSY